MNRVIKLQYPVKVEGHEYSLLTMRRPKVKDRLVVDRSDLHQSESELLYFANLCEVAPDVIEELDWADFVSLREALQEFLVSSPKD